RDTTLRSRDDMVYRHWDTSLFGGTQAIFTAILGSHSHESSQSRRQSCHLDPPPTFLRLLYPRQTMTAPLQKRIGFSLQSSEALSCLYQRLQHALFIRCERITCLVLRD